MPTRIRYTRRTTHELTIEVRDRLAAAMKNARKMMALSVTQLAQMIGVNARAVRLIEAGAGSVETLILAMDALKVCWAEIGPGASLPDQLARRRGKLGWSIAEAAEETGLSETEVTCLERGAGDMTSLNRLLARIAPTVRRKAPERAHWSKSEIEERNSRFTPSEFMNPIYDAFGPISTDPCANRMSPVVADRRIIQSEGGDGLTEPWSGPTAFVNPPFSRTRDWMDRAYQQLANGNIQTLLLLIPPRVDNSVFQTKMWEHAHIFFIAGRLKFADPNGNVSPTPYALSLMAFGTTRAQRARFAELVDGHWFEASDRRTYVEPSACIPGSSLHPDHAASASKLSPSGMTMASGPSESTTVARRHLTRRHAGNGMHRDSAGTSIAGAWASGENATNCGPITFYDIVHCGKS